MTRARSMRPSAGIPVRVAIVADIRREFGPVVRALVQTAWRRVEIIADLRRSSIGAPFQAFSPQTPRQCWRLSGGFHPHADGPRNGCPMQWAERTASLSGGFDPHADRPRNRGAMKRAARTASMPCSLIRHAGRIQYPAGNGNGAEEKSRRLLARWNVHNDIGQRDARDHEDD